MITKHSFETLRHSFIQHRNRGNYLCMHLVLIDSKKIEGDKAQLLNHIKGKLEGRATLLRLVNEVIKPPHVFKNDDLFQARLEWIALMENFFVNGKDYDLYNLALRHVYYYTPSTLWGRFRMWMWRKQNAHLFSI